MKHYSSNAIRLLTVCSALCFASVAFGQIEKGAWLFSGGSNLGNTSFSQSGGGSSSAFNLDLKGGYFFMDNLAAGALLNLLSYSGSSTTGIGLFARYYVQGKFFLGAGFQSWSTSGGGGSTTQIPVEVGYAFFVNNAIAVEPGLKLTTFSGGSTFNIGIGFTVFLGRG